LYVGSNGLGTASNPGGGGGRERDGLCELLRRGPAAIGIEFGHTELVITVDGEDTVLVLFGRVVVRSAGNVRTRVIHEL